VLQRRCLQERVSHVRAAPGPRAHQLPVALRCSGSCLAQPMRRYMTCSPCCRFSHGTDEVVDDGGVVAKPVQPTSSRCR
jgi:hypothetical protein